MPTTLVVRARRLYGAHPLQLVLILASFVVVGYALSLLGFEALWDPDTWWQSIALWFVGAALAHDILLFPAYAAADRILVAVTGGRTRSAATRARIPVINFVRVPLLACGLITLLFFPGLIEQGAGTYNRATGQTQEPFLHRWVILCGLILLLGLVAYLVARLTWGRRAGADLEPPPDLMERLASTPPDAHGPAPRATGTPAWAVLAVAVLVVLAARRGRGSSPSAKARVQVADRL